MALPPPDRTLIRLWTHSYPFSGRPGPPLPRSLPRPPGSPGGQRVAGARPLPESRSAEEAEAAAAPRPRRAHGVARVSAALGPRKRGLRRGRGRGEASPSPGSPGPAALSGRPWAEGWAGVGGRAGEGSAPLVVVSACPLAAPRGRGRDAGVSAARAGRPRAPGASWVPGGAAGLRGWPCSDITPVCLGVKMLFPLRSDGTYRVCNFFLNPYLKNKTTDSL